MVSNSLSYSMDANLVAASTNMSTPWPNLETLFANDLLFSCAILALSAPISPRNDLRASVNAFNSCDALDTACASSD